VLLLPYSGTRTLLFPDVRIPLRKRYHGRFTDKSFVEKYIQARLSFRAILSKVLLSWFFTNMQRDGFFTNMQQDGLYVKGRVCRLDLVIWKFITPWCSLRWFTVIEIIILSNNTIEQMDLLPKIFFKIYNCYSNCLKVQYTQTRTLLFEHLGKVLGLLPADSWSRTPGS